jgi:hypothetical protein
MASALKPPSTLRLLREPVLFVWACYVLLSPVYVARGGLPQPADALIVLLVPLALFRWDGRLSRPTVQLLRPLLAFTLWVCAVSVAWAVLLWDFGFNLVYPLYYIYNTSFFFGALLLYRRYGDPFLRLTVLLVFATVVLQVAASVFIGESGRNQLFFDNPNQLGYYALLAACVISLAQRRLGFGAVGTSIGLLCCGYLALLSSSRSSAAGIAFLVVLLLFANPRVLLVAGLASIALTVVDTRIDDSVGTLQRRINERRNEHLSFFEQRGYDRIWSYKEHVLLGAAEGNRWRWKERTKIGSAEIHSSAGTIIFSYGLPGVLLFAMFLVRILRRAPVRFALMLLPPLFYSVAHQGLRFTTLWVLLALFVAVKERTRPRDDA